MDIVPNVKTFLLHMLHASPGARDPAPLMGYVNAEASPSPPITIQPVRLGPKAAQVGRRIVRHVTNSYYGYKSGPEDPMTRIGRPENEDARRLLRKLTQRIPQYRP
jgi:hypothetical protein